MTKKELIEALKRYDDDDNIHFCYPSGDYWGRTLVCQIDKLEEEYVEWSEYHRSLKLVEQNERERIIEDIEEGIGEKEDLDKLKCVLVIS